VNETNSVWKFYKVELQLSGLIVRVCHPDIQKIRIIGFFFKNRLHWQFENDERYQLDATIMIYYHK